MSTWGIDRGKVLGKRIRLGREGAVKLIPKIFKTVEVVVSHVVGDIPGSVEDFMRSIYINVCGGEKKHFINVVD